MSAKIKRNICRMKDPGSAITHLIAMVSAAIAAVPLLIKAAKTPGYLHTGRPIRSWRISARALRCSTA